jgi:hypothetical protein
MILWVKRNKLPESAQARHRMAYINDIASKHPVTKAATMG